MGIGAFFAVFFLLTGNRDWVSRQTPLSALVFVLGWIGVCAAVAVIGACGAALSVLVSSRLGRSSGYSIAAAVGAGVFVAATGVIADLLIAPWPIYSYIGIPAAALAAAIAAFVVRRVERVSGPSVK
jgi:hypothetical protein